MFISCFSRKLYDKSSFTINVKSRKNYVLKGKVSTYNVSANNQAGGQYLKDNQHLYYVINNQLLVSDLDELETSEVLIDDCVGYLSIENHVLYYCDSQYNYQAYDLKTKTTTQILENVYYPIIKIMLFIIN